MWVELATRLQQQDKLESEEPSDTAGSGGRGEQWVQEWEVSPCVQHVHARCCGHRPSRLGQSHTGPFC